VGMLHLWVKVGQSSYRPLHVMYTLEPRQLGHGYRGKGWSEAMVKVVLLGR